MFAVSKATFIRFILRQKSIWTLGYAIPIVSVSPATKSSKRSNFRNEIPMLDVRKRFVLVQLTRGFTTYIRLFSMRDFHFKRKSRC